MILRQIGPTIFKISSSANGMWTVQTLINCLDSHEEVERLRARVARDGPGRWSVKAKQLGTGRTAKALNTRWLREAGRIPRTSARSAAPGKRGAKRR